MKRLLALSALVLLTAPLAAQDVPPPVTPASIIAAAPEGDWKAIDPADLMVMTLAPDASGAPRVVTIQLIPPPFSAGWVANVRTLAKAHWWDGTSVYRVVDNWVTQWGDGEDDEAKAKPLPPGMLEVPESEYTLSGPTREVCSGSQCVRAPGIVDAIPAEVALDPYAPNVAFSRGWPLGFADGFSRSWPLHCYATVGVARDLSPNTGTGAELYAVIGQAPRQLDRNIAIVGRVIEGIEHLSALPRGKAEMGVYGEGQARVPILSVRLGNELQAPEQPKFEYLGTDSESFARYAQVSANRNDPFYRVAAGGIDVCNLKVPVRRVTGE